jgi:putative ABC transport system permease protein
VIDWTVVAAVAASQARRRWRSLVLLGLLAGLVGGVATASFAGARRSSTAYDRLLVATDFPDAFVQLVEPAPGLPDRIAASPAVEESVSSTFAVGRDAARRNQVLIPVQAAEEPISKLVVVRGRAPDPAVASEVTVSEGLADSFGLGVGDRFAYEGLDREEFDDLLRDRWDGSASGLRIDLEVVGVTRFPTDAVLGEFPTLIGTPALVERFEGSLPDALGVWVHLRDGATVGDLRSDLGGAGSDQADNVEIIDLGGERAALDDAVNVLVWGLVIFGIVALAAGTVVLAQLVARIMERAGAERLVLRDLGVDRRTRRAATAASGVISVAVAVATSSVVAVVASRWTPIGVARRVEPSPGVDWNLVLLAGGSLTTGLLVAASFLVAAAGWRNRRSHVPAGRFAGAASGVLQAGPIGSVAAASAFGAGRRVAASRIAFAGVVAGVCGVVAVSLFGASLEGLSTEPIRWGALGQHLVEVPDPVRDRTEQRLDTAAEVEAFAEVEGSSVVVEGRRVDAFRFTARRGSIAPVLIEGSLPAAGGEVALGPTLLDQLGLDVGDRVAIDGDPARVVGSVLTFGIANRSTVTEGVLLGGPGRADFTTLVVRYRDGVDVDRAASRLYGELEYFAPSRPADVTNLAALGPLPPLLLVLLGVIGAAALTHLSFGIGGRGRRDLAVLRSLGFSPSDATRVVVLATALVVLAATVIGAPLGVVLGRSVWTVVAQSTDLAADVRFPPQLLAAPLGLAGLSALAGLWSGRRAARRAVPEVLRAE